MADDRTDLSHHTDPSRTDPGHTDPGHTDPDGAELDEFAPPRDLSRQAALVSAVLSVVAGVLCVVAPFRAVYTLRASGISASFDGWGRYDLASGSQHGPRYGAALTVAALVLVIAAATRLRDLRPARPLEEEEEQELQENDVPAEAATQADDPAGTATTDDRLAAGIGVAGSALLLGVLASVALSVESTVSNADAIAGSGGQSTSVDVGAMLWLLVGGWVASVLAVYLPWFEARRRR